LSESRLGFKPEADEVLERRVFTEMEKRMRKLYEERFSAEFRNRVDEVIIFHPLQREHVLQIVDVELRPVREELAQKASASSSPMPLRNGWRIWATTNTTVLAPCAAPSKPMSPTPSPSASSLAKSARATP